jgi:glycosyltransferase involved in cell wall biosynthesis
LQRHAREDGRIRVIRQDNAGLTAALVRGCEAARGEFIARQDAGGDVSVPGRLQLQGQLMRRNPEIVLHSCATRFLGPAGEFLFDRVVTTRELEVGLNTLRLPGVQGPSSHPACMFRRAAYERVGGYRRAFTVAQDIDLWLRLAEVGAVATVPDVLYETCWTLGGLSSRWRKEQLLFAEAAIATARQRRAGRPEQPLPLPLSPDLRRKATARRSDRAAFHYFVGACIAARNPSGARAHFWQALKAQPWALRTWVRWVHPSLGSAG